jgi:hypothetical protein
VIQGPDHHFLGASTAVFGALGVLGGLRSVSGMRGMTWREAAPFVAGLMLLALLGAGEEDGPGKIDLGGHFLGFAAGAVLGGAVGLARRLGGRSGADPILGVWPWRWLSRPGYRPILAGVGHDGRGQERFAIFRHVGYADDFDAPAFAGSVFFSDRTRMGRGAGQGREQG